jgi:hypothetical protein
MAADVPMQSDSTPTSLGGDWPAEIEATESFSDPLVGVFPWSSRYPGSGYTRLLETHQEHILLEAARRTALLDTIGGAIERIGGQFEMPFVTHVRLTTCA